MKKCTHHWKINRGGSAYCTKCPATRRFDIFVKPDRLLEGKREIAENHRELNDLVVVFGGRKPWLI